MRKELWRDGLGIIIDDILSWDYMKDISFWMWKEKTSSR
jgi:hypothetical protein